MADEHKEAREYIIRDLYQKVKELRKIYERDYPSLTFNLDGNLVGDLGEVIVAENYKVELVNRNEKGYDAIYVDSNKKECKVQIKATFMEKLQPPSDVPDYYIAIKLKKDGTWEEVYNGLAELITNKSKISINTLKNIQVNKKIEKR